jgi:hypothetical protein
MAVQRDLRDQETCAVGWPASHSERIDSLPRSLALYYKEKITKLTVSAIVPIDADTILSTTPDCLTAEVDGELVLMSVANGRYFGLDGIGTDILGRLSAPIRFADLIADLGLAYDAPATVIETDTRDLLEQLMEQGLIEIQS